MKYDILKENGVDTSVKFIAEGDEYISGNGIYLIKTDENGHKWSSYILRGQRKKNRFKLAYFWSYLLSHILFY